MRMKEIHRRILGGCLACLLCFTGSIPAFAAETATPANADERTEILPDLESEAPGHWIAEPGSTGRSIPRPCHRNTKGRRTALPARFHPAP